MKDEKQNPDLHPSSFTLHPYAAYVTQGTELLHLDAAGTRRVVLSGFGGEDRDHVVHTPRWGPDGRLYFQQGIAIHSHVETPCGLVRLNSAGGFAYDPRTGRLEVFARGLVNPRGHAWDRWGQSFFTDAGGDGGISWVFPGATFAASEGARAVMPSISPGAQPKFCGLEIISSPHFPADWQGSAVTCDFRAHRVVRLGITDLAAEEKDEGGRMKDEGKHAAAPTGHAPSPATGGQTPSSFIPHPSSFSPSSGYTTRALPDLVRTDDVSFRPIDVKLGPDGALYVADWSDPVIHHSEGDVRDPRRDHHSGRIWRISKKGAAVVQWEPLVGKTKRELLTTLVRTDSLWEKEQSRRIVQVRNWRSSADDEGKLPAELAEVGGLEFARILQADQSVDPSRLGKLLSAKEPNVRAAVLRIIGPWYPGIVEMYKGRAKREEDKLKDAPMPGDRWFLSEGDPIVRADNFPNDEPDRSRALVKYWDDFQPFARAIADPNPRVRLEAMRALARIPTARSAELVLDAAMKAPADDVYYRHAAWLSINELAKPWTEAIASGKWKAAGREAQLAFGLKALPPDLARDTLARVLADGKADLATGPWIDLIGHCGGPDDLRRLYEMLLVSYGTDCCPDPAVEALQAAPVNDATALRILAALLDSARLRDVRPSGNLATLERLVLQTKDAVRADSVRLVGYWKPAGALRWLETALADGQAPLNPAGVANAIASVREVGGAPAIALLKKLAADSPPARAALLRAALEAGDVREEK